MNERIEELMIQAGARFEFLHGVHYDDFQYRKFAELIVRECIKTVAYQELISVPEHNWEDKKIGYNEGIRTAKKKLKEHFGLK